MLTNFIYANASLELFDIYTCCSHSGSVDDPDQNYFQKNFTKI